MRFKHYAVLTLVLVLVLGLSTVAQETTGTITGFVKDNSGAVIPNVDVVIRNSARGIERHVKSGPEGEYTAAALPIGTYSVVVEHAGFKKFVAENVILNVNDRLRVDPVLQVGAVAEQVTVEAAQAPVQTENSTVGSVITGQTVTALPLNGRSLYQLMALQPGVTAASGILSGRVGYGLDATAQVQINGSRGSQNNWLIDGGDNVDTGSNLGMINYISIDTVSEFRLLRGNYNAEFGRSGGGQVNVVTKGGSNQFHGSAYEFFRNDVLDARPYFKPTCDALVAQGKIARPGTNCDAPLLRYHDFGGTFGGPIKKDKLFFFYGEELRRVRQVRGNGVINTRVPTDAQKRGDFSGIPNLFLRDPLLTGTCSATSQTACFPGNVIPSNRLDPNGVAILSLWPAANATPATAGGGNNNYTVSTPSSRNYREELARIDYNFSDKHHFYARYMQDTMPSAEPFNEVFGSSNADLPGIFSSDTKNVGKNLVAEWNWVPNSTMVNSFAFNYSKGGIFSAFTGQALRSNFPNYRSPEIFPDNAAGALPAITIGGYAGFGGLQGGPFAPYFNTYGSHRLKDTLAWVKGKHSLKFGYLFSWEFKNEDNGGSAATAGSFTFPSATTTSYISTGDGFANFLLGRASVYAESDIDMFSKLRYNMHEAFGQDDWKVLPNLTLNLGVRWSYILPARDVDNRLTNFVPALWDPTKAPQIDSAGNRVPGTGDPMNGIIIAGQNSPWGDYVTEKHADTIGPRIGFAWDPLKDGKTSVRGGYGIYFDRTLSGIALQNAFVNPPFVTAARFTSTLASGPTFTVPNGGQARNNAAVVPGLIAMSPDFKIPTTQQWSFGVQREIKSGIALDVAYVGSHATHLLREVRINQTPPGAATSTAAATAIAPYRGYGNIRVRDTSASSRYDSLQIAANKKFFRGLQLGMAYTWGKVLTDSPDDRSTIPMWIGNLRAERALASFDKNHVFVATWMYSLPFFKNASKTMYNLAGGWEIGGLWRLEAGTPMTMFVSGDQSNSFFGGTNRLNITGDPNGQKTQLSWFNTAAFFFPAANTFGNSSRSVVRGPGINQADITIFKNFKVQEQIGLQFRAEMFNAFNHTNWSGVGTSADAKFFNPALGATATPQFGQVTSALDPREIQLALKLTF